jgi:hypothetical protein
LSIRVLVSDALATPFKNNNGTQIVMIFMKE